MSAGAQGWGRSVSRALGAVAAAGLLASLYFLVAPERSLQRELVAATDHSPPFQIVRPDGTITGAVVEALNLAAERAGIRLRWVHLEVRPDDVLRDLDSSVDLWPMVNVTPERKDWFHTTQPIGRAEYQIAAIDDGRIRLKDYQPKRVAMTGGAWLRRQLEKEFPNAEPVIVKSGEQLTALCDGRADALVADAASMFMMALQIPPACAGKRILNRLLGDWYWDLAIGSTFARAAEADRIRAEFGHLARTGALHEVFADYPVQAQYRSQDTFAETRSERERRHATATFVGLCVCCLAMLGILALTRHRAAEVIRLVNLKSEFLDRMSHELRTPLNGVLGLASLLASTPLTPQQAEYLRLIRQCGEDLLKLVSDSLALSRLTARSGTKVSPSVLFEPRVLIEDTVAVLAPLAHSKDLDLVWLVNRSVPRQVRGDPDSFRQLLINLIGNALKYSPSGKVRVTLRATGLETGFPFLHCEVDDSGPGIPPEERLRVFESFVRLNREADKHVVGTGLGLAIARELVGMLNGKIGIRESEFGGARFWFEIPVQLSTCSASLDRKRIAVRVLTPAESVSEPEEEAAAAEAILSGAPPPAQPGFPLRSVHLVGDVLPKDREPAAIVGGNHTPELQVLARAILPPVNTQTEMAAGIGPAGAWTPQDGCDGWLSESLEMVVQHLETRRVTMHYSRDLEDALSRAQTIERVDLLVLESGRTGPALHALVGELRKQHGQPMLPVIVLAGGSGGDSACQGKRPAWLRVLRHPFLVRRFERALEELGDELRGGCGLEAENDAVAEPELRLVPCEQSECPSWTRERRAGRSVSPELETSHRRRAGATATTRRQTSIPDGSDASEPGDSSAPARALIADDNSVNQLILVAMLRTLGVEADVVTDGREALAACEQRQYAYLILDHHMPLLDGVKAAESLRLENDWRRHVPIIACSAADVRTSAERYREAGIDAVLPKPFTLKQLQEALGEAASHAGTRQQGIPEALAGALHAENALSQRIG